MTVSELIEILKKCDQDASVRISVAFNCSKSISNVREKEREVEGKLVVLY